MIVEHNLYSLEEYQLINPKTLMEQNLYNYEE